MDILLVAATAAEIGPFINHLQEGGYQVSADRYEVNGNTIDVCITGVGMVATTYAVTRALAKKQYMLALQAGIGGSFDRQIALGSLVMVNSEQFGDLGAEDNGAYLDIFEMGLQDRDVFPFSGGRLDCPQSALHEQVALRHVTGLTVNTVTGTTASAQRLVERYSTGIESMEGGAFHYTCLLSEVPFMQVRAISNYVEARDKSKWKMKEAVIALNQWLISYLCNNRINV